MGEKRKVGRPTKYKPEYCQEIIKFFDRELVHHVAKEVIHPKDGVISIMEERATDLPLFEAFAHSIDVHVDTLHEWKKVYPEFSESYKRAKQLQKEHLVTNAMQGRYSNSFAIFTAKNILGWRDKQEIESNVNQNVTVTIDGDDAKL